MRLFQIALASALLASPAAADMSLTFTWGAIPACNSGNPNTVGSPEFVVRGVPEGTTSIQLKLKDLDAPGYNHGGSKKLKVTQDALLPFGTFKYKSPCPPGEVHTYEWTATARSGNTVVGTASARRVYPE